MLDDQLPSTEQPRTITMPRKKQGMLDNIDTREKPAHPSYKDKEQLDFQVLLAENYYVNPNSIHLCFPIKIKKNKLTTTAT